MDTIVIDYISFTENTISRFLVIEYIITMLLKGSEPLFQEVSSTCSDIDSLFEGCVRFQMQYQLSVQVSDNFNMMNIVEFHTAMENIAYTTDERLVSRVFNRAERHSQWNNLKDSVLMTKLARTMNVFSLTNYPSEFLVDIASFFYFHQFIEEQKDALHEKMQSEMNLNIKSEADYSKQSHLIFIVGALH